jgi:arabinofuranosyltransferase
LFGPGIAALRAGWREHWHAVVAIGTLAAHLGYYTLVVGGDHFEYRVYSYTVWLSFLSAAWLSAWLCRRRALGLALVVAFMAASWPIPWTHWAGTRHLETREETHVLIHPIANAFPAPLRPVVEVWDAWQAWLIEHHVGMRHQEHKVFWIAQIARNSSREDGAQIVWKDNPVMLTGQVGVPGWVLPNVAILDYFGLNDAIVARQPRTADRLMAHGRVRPDAYYRCFRPNVRREGTRAVLRERDTPLTDDQIRRCQEFFWNELRRSTGGEAGRPVRPKTIPRRAAKRVGPVRPETTPRREAESR